MNRANDPLRLAELVCARLCHDLSGPLGALIGAVEIAREENPGSETAILADEAAVELAHRLRLLRAAWGREGEALGVGDICRLAEGLSAGRRVQLDVSGLAPDVVFPPSVARLILNLLLMAAECLPAGGTIALAGLPDGSVLLTLAGARAAWPAEFARYLADETAAWQAVTSSPRTMQAPLTALLAGALECRLSMLMPAGASGGDPPPLLLSFGGR